MDSKTKPEVSYTDFLKVIESPQFRNNAERIFEYLQATEEASWTISRIIAACRREFYNIFLALEDLFFLRNLRATGAIKGEGYFIKDPSIIESVAGIIEADYLNKLLGFEKIYGNRKLNEERVEEIRKSILQSWTDISDQSQLSAQDYISSFDAVRELDLRSPMSFEKFVVDWIEKVVYCLPYSDAIVLAGRPVKLNSIEQQANQILSVLDTGRNLLETFEAGLADDFIVSLLISRVVLDNKLYRDIYNVLLLFNRLPKELVKSHGVSIESNRYVRENYIKQRVNRLIEQEPDLKLWYKTIVKSAKKKKP